MPIVIAPGIALRSLLPLTAVGASSSAIGPSAYHTDGGKAPSFTAAGPAMADGGAYWVHSNVRFAVAQIGQYSDRGTDTAGNLARVG